MTSTIKRTYDNGIEMIFAQKTITIPANTNITVSLSEYIPSGKNIIAISNVRCGEYALPYVNNDIIRTYISEWKSDGTFNISNTVSAWNNYSLNMILFVR